MHGVVALYFMIKHKKVSGTTVVATTIVEANIAAKIEFSRPE
jgi:hypothetical protein